MDDLEKIRQKKIAELKDQHQETDNQQQKFQEEVNKFEAYIKPYFTKKALERFGNIKTAHPQKAVRLLGLIAEVLQRQKIKEINDQKLRELLIMITPKQDFKIKHI